MEFLNEVVVEDYIETAAAAKRKKYTKPEPGHLARSPAARKKALANRLKSARGKKISAALKNKPKSSTHKKRQAASAKRYWAAVRSGKIKRPKTKVQNGKIIVTHRAGKRTLSSSPRKAAAARKAKRGAAKAAKSVPAKKTGGATRRKSL